MPDALNFEDFPPGEVVEYGGVDLSAEEIIAFAQEFDPQPFHTDDEAARAATGDLIASGWHTCALLLRMNCEAFLMRAVISSGRVAPPEGDLGYEQTRALLTTTVLISRRICLPQPPEMGPLRLHFPSAK